MNDDDEEEIGTDSRCEGGNVLKGPQGGGGGGGGRKMRKSAGAVRAESRKTGRGGKNQGGPSQMGWKSAAN
ncbi:hypothetical protein DAPPUDRAFT_233982 [Daphnia pulex]|uniref:Uncharacterized protein n=1 Tax=Daphnia pulex TaxID=6669 RepID=E9FWA0_DAPPU|nr:hypothetical protein DAPPUDRAFT_233982 [Daphnia pulex]|eukprot:EFX88688.1 hypothetical protein DAPPUDRAFT_233982 [Daphnia pulex]